MHLILLFQKCEGMHSFHSKTHGKKTKREKITQNLRKAIHANLANGKKRSFPSNIVWGKKTTHGNIVT